MTRPRGRIYTTSRDMTGAGDGTLGPKYQTGGRIQLPAGMSGKGAAAAPLYNRLTILCIRDVG